MWDEALIATPIAGDESEQATGLAEQLAKTAAQLGVSRCYVVLQGADHGDALDRPLEAHLAEHGTTPHPVDVSPLPAEFWPSVLSLDLDRGPDALINGVLAGMAVADAQMDALIEGRTHRVVGWVFTTLTAVQLALRIKTLALRYCLSKRRTQWVRFYDPLVADLHWHLMTPVQRSQWLDGIDGWAWLDRWGALTVARSPGAQETSASAFSQTQWQQCDAIAPLNQAWIRACAEGQRPDKHRLIGAFDATVQGASLGIQQRADSDLFAWHALTLGPQFYRREPYATPLHQGLSAGQRYCLIAKHFVNPDNASSAPDDDDLKDWSFDHG